MKLTAFKHLPALRAEVLDRDGGWCCDLAVDQRRDQVADLFEPIGLGRQCLDNQFAKW